MTVLKKKKNSVCCLATEQKKIGREKEWRTAHSCGVSWTGWQRWPRKAESDEYHRPVKWK